MWQQRRHARCSLFGPLSAKSRKPEGPQDLTCQPSHTPAGASRGKRAGFPQPSFGLRPDAVPSLSVEPLAMTATYAVTWQEGGGPVRHGKLELRPGTLVLEGSDCSGPPQ